MSKTKKKGRHRNAGSLATVRRPRPQNKAGDEIDVGTILAALGGGLGGAFAGGWLASRGWTEEAVSAVMAVGGGVAAALTDGPARVASMGVAAAGAGQFALTLFGDDDKDAEKLDKRVKAAAEKLTAEKLAAAAKAGADKPDAGKLANAAAPYGAEQAFYRARARLASLHDDEAADLYADA